MDPNRWQRVRALLDKAFDLEPVERDEFLQKECGEDDALRRQVESLIAADEGAGAIFDVATLERGESQFEKDHQIGPYRILQVLGEGGMGVVYKAEQETPVRRKVAMKLIKLGMDTKAVVARFESERQALALMSHPNIASVYDAGATDDGRPYFVMEFVDGIPITDYCDKHRLSVKERLDLFTAVCDGVQHAHLKGVIHRDIKPSNVLVTIRGDKPLPKIIDFGVAKATSQRLAEKTVFTELGQLIGTPEYMSPEQAEMTGLDIDARTDVYSLGVLLYELLVGTQPYDPKELRKAGFNTIVRKIREEDPPAPSTRLKSLGGASTTTARNRKVELPNLMRQLRGDLDWITMKAMEKDRTRRYSTPNDLATDLDRHLRHEPVIARPVSTTYRIGKFVRRHKAGVAAAVLVILALIAGGAAATVGFVRATRAEQSARQEAERTNQEAETAKQVSDFLVELFKVSDPGEARGSSITAREILDRGAEQIPLELADQPRVQARLMHTMGRVFTNLGLYEEAQSLLERAAETQENLLVGEDRLELAYTLNDLGAVCRKQGKVKEAEPSCRRSLEIREELLGPDHTLTTESLNGLAIVTAIQGKYAEAEELFLRALELHERKLGSQNTEVAKVLANLGALHGIQGQHAEAVPFFRRALEIDEKALGLDHPQVGAWRNNLALALEELGEYRESEELYRSALENQEKSLGRTHPAVANTLNGIGELYARQGLYDNAESSFLSALTILTENIGEEHPFVADAHYGLGNLCRSQGRYHEAELHYRRSLAIREKLYGPNHPQVVETLEDYADFLRKAGRAQEADRMDQRAAAARAKSS